MINLIISILGAAVIFLVFNLALGVSYAGILPGLITFGASYFLLARRTMRKIEVIFQTANMELEKQHINRAIEILKSGYALAPWQFFVKGQVNAQIGTIFYVQKKFKEAEPYLEKAFVRHWIARAMLAVIYYKRKDYAKMSKLFEASVKSSKKESLLWNLYAYCAWKSGDRDKAIEILNRALKALPDEERTKTNRTALQNKGKMKMKPWKDMWYQFHLARLPQQKVRFDRRQVYRGRPGRGR